MLEELHKIDPRVLCDAEGLTPRPTKQRTNRTDPVSVGLKIAITLSFLTTGESDTGRNYQFRAGKATISKFILNVSKAIQQEFTQDISHSIECYI